MTPPDSFLSHIRATTCYRGGRVLLGVLALVSVAGAVVGTLVFPAGMVGYWLGAVAMLAIRAAGLAVFDLADAALLRLSLESRRDG